MPNSRGPVTLVLVLAVALLGATVHTVTASAASQRAPVLGSKNTPLYKPGGGYYRKMGRIVLRAQRLGHCGQGGRRAYTRMHARSARKPGGPVSKRWHPWSPDANICRWG